MKKIVSILLLISISTGFLMGCTREKKVEANGDFKGEVETMADALISDYGVMSVQYGIMDNGKIVLSNTAGNYSRESEKKLDENTMYGIASISKMYVTGAIMNLVDKGEVELDSPIVKYLPDFKMKDDRYKDITVRMLLNHSSGLYGSHYYNSSTYGQADSYAQDKLLQSLENETLNTNPGEFSVYCNDGFQLLELIVEAVSNISYTEFLEENILKPLGLENTKTPYSDFDRDNLAKLYEKNLEKELPTLNVNVLGTGGIYSTAEEVLKFSDALMGNKEDIISKKSAMKMQKEEYKKGVWPEDDVNDDGYGLGWDSTNLWPFSEFGIKALAKGGDQSYHSSLIILPDFNISMAVVSSDGLSLYNQAFASKVLMKYLLDKGIIDKVEYEKTFEKPTPVEIPKTLMSYQGLYGNGTVAGTSYEVKFEKDSFTLPKRFDGLIPEEKFIYIGDNQFKTKDGSKLAKFVEGKNGKTYIQTRGYLDFPKIGQIVISDFAAVKLDRNMVADDVIKQWQDRKDKRYFAIEEGKNSDVYLNYFMLVKKIYINDWGYVLNNKIVDENNGKNSIAIPNSNGRDLTDLNFYQKDGAEYLKTIDMTFIREDYIKTLDVKMDKVTIDEKGHAQWFKIGNLKEKTIEVDSLNNRNFAVYDKYGTCKNINSLVKENKSILPEDGYIVFMGDKGEEFNLKIK